MVDASSIIWPFGCSLGNADADTVHAAYPKPLSGTERGALSQPEHRAERHTHPGALSDSHNTASHAGVVILVTTTIAFAIGRSNTLTECLAYALTFSDANVLPESCSDTYAVDAAFCHSEQRAICSRGLDNTAAVVQPEHFSFKQPHSRPLTLAD